MLPCLTHINLSLGSVLAFRTLDLQDNVPDFFYLKYFWSVQTRFIFFRSTDPLPNLDCCWENLDPTWLSNLTELLETCPAKKSLREWMHTRLLHFDNDTSWRDEIENYHECWGGLIGRCEICNFSILFFFFKNRHVWRYESRVQYRNFLFWLDCFLQCSTI